MCHYFFLKFNGSQKAMDPRKREGGFSYSWHGHDSRDGTGDEAN